MLDSRPLLIATDFPVIHRQNLDILQVNLGYKCNLSCVHCHVNAGPTRTEMMDAETIDLIVRFVKQHKIKIVDLTGGAPELNPHFRELVVKLRALSVEVIDRCNLTVLFEPGQEDLAGFLAQQNVTITASLPCYSQENVEQQRGKGVFNDSIRALKKLNALGYGVSDRLQLNLVYNPVGPVLPPAQQTLENAYKKELNEHFGVRFNQLYTITNMPISRFGAVLMSQGQFDDYMALLKANFSDDNLSTVMCKNLISIDWQGYVYDCDFNQMLELPLNRATDHAAMNKKTHLTELLGRDLSGQEIVVGEHCFGCTAGQGSSCGGALND